MKRQFLQEPEDIKNWLIKYNIRTFDIIENMHTYSKTPWMVNVHEHVHLNYQDLDFLPVQFHHVYGNFDISGNHLSNLKGVPFQVDGYFSCSNNKIKSLKYCPSHIKEGLILENNLIENLRYCPTTIHGGFYCNGNRLKSLKYGPTNVSGDFDCSKNQLQNLDFIPETVDGKFFCDHNSRLKELQNVGFIEKIKELLEQKEQMRYLKFHKKLQKIKTKPVVNKIKL